MSYFKSSIARQRALSLLSKMLLNLYEIDDFEIHEAVIGFHGRIAKKYPKCDEYRLFHLLMGSTPPPYTKEWDFPGEDSIQSFIIGKYKESLPKIPCETPVELDSEESIPAIY